MIEPPGPRAKEIIYRDNNVMSSCMSRPYSLVIECARQIETHIFKKELSPKDTAAIVVEPIQGEGGYIVPPPEFHHEIRRICDDHDILMVADEVQAGCYRTVRSWQWKTSA